MTNTIPLLIKHVHPNSDFTIIQHDGHEYRTSKRLAEMGMACCSQCGSIISTFPIANWCDSCKEYVLIIGEDIPTKATPKATIKRAHIPYAIAPYEREEAGKLCNVCNALLRKMPPAGSRCYGRHGYFRTYNRHTLERLGLYKYERNKRRVKC